MFSAILGQNGWPTDSSLEYAKGCKSSCDIQSLQTMLTTSSVVPSFILINSAWCSRKDQPLRFGVWFSANGLAQNVGGLFSYGLGHIHVATIHLWKWMFLITAALSVFWSLFLILSFPTSQATAKWLTDEGKVAVVEMVRDNNTGIHNRTFNPAHLKEALLDPKTYIFFCFAFFGNLPNSVSTVNSQSCFLM